MDIVIIPYHNDKSFNLMSASDIISIINGIKKDYDFKDIVILGNTPQDLSNIQDGLIKENYNFYDIIFIKDSEKISDILRYDLKSKDWIAAIDKNGNDLKRYGSRIDIAKYID